MAITVKHKFVSAIPDAGDPTIVQPSNWNDTHDLTGFGTSATLDAGVANGVATLDGSGTVPISQLPAAVLGALSYQGTWNASTNTPTLTSSVGTKGYYYIVNVAGSTNLNGITDWKVGDWAVYNGTAWQKVDNTDAVTSVNGYTGTVVLTNADISGFGTMSTQNNNAVSITGGNIDNTNIGEDTAGTGAFSELYALGIFQAQGQLQSFVPTGTAPFAVTSTTPVANLNIGGNAATATKTSITNNTTSSAEWYPTIVSAIAGNLAQTVSSANFSFVPSTGVLSAIAYTGTWEGDTIAVNRGGTGVTTSSGANSVVLRDANGNITTNGLFEGYVTQAASGTTIVLTASTAQNYQITGSGGQIIKLPNATTLPNGATFTFNNNQSSGAITVQNNSSTTIATINSGGYVTVVLLNNSTAAGTWDRHDSTPANVSWSTNTLDYPGSITSATWNGATVTVNRGGTGATTLTGYVKGSGTSALTANATIPTTDLSGTITNAQLANSAITINGTSTSLGGSINVGTVTNVTGTSPVVSSGGATPAISMPAATGSVNGYLTSTDWTTFNNKSNTNGTVTSVAALTLGTTGTDLSSTVANGTTTPVITLQVPTASATNRGALSSTDWTTFNGKANAFTYTTNYIPYGQGTTTPNQNANFTFDGTTQTAPIQRASNGIVVNSKTVSASYTIASGDAGMSVGPVTVASGQTVTIASGSRWVVL